MVDNIPSRSQEVASIIGGYLESCDVAATSDLMSYAPVGLKLSGLHLSSISRLERMLNVLLHASWAQMTSSLSVCQSGLSATIASIASECWLACGADVEKARFA
jgi:hypothetical protein